MLIWVNNLPDAGVSAGYQCKHRGKAQQIVLDEPPLQEAPVLWLLPEGDNLDDSGHQQPKDREADGSHKWDEWLQIWEGDGNHHWTKDIHISNVVPKEEKRKKEEWKF